MKKKEATLRTRVQSTFAEQVDIAAKQVGLNISEYLRIALIEKLSRDTKHPISNSRIAK